MAAAGAAASIAGGGLQAIGSIEAGNAAKQAGEYNASVDDYDAAQTLNDGAIAVAKQQRQATQVIGSAKAAYGASGVDSNQGSALQVLQQSATQSALDAINIKQQYAAKAFSYTASAAMSRYNGSQSQTSSYYSAAGQLLGAGAKAGQMMAGAGAA